MTLFDRRKLLSVATAALALAGVLSTPARADDFPTKPITMLVGY